MKKIKKFLFGKISAAFLGFQKKWSDFLFPALDVNREIFYNDSYGIVTFLFLFLLGKAQRPFLRINFPIPEKKEKEALVDLMKQRNESLGENGCWIPTLNNVL
ncbi:MAG: hypothetical protein Q4D62_00285 [Planctomycetia bacterium]|nr:hypothetical protein [Planctomycetia bacterium]